MENTIPDDNHDYAKMDYWDSRFKNEESYDWLGKYKSYQDLFTNILEDNNLSKDTPILIIGCGNSSLSYDMFQDGFSNIVSSDYSEIVIEKMKEKYGEINTINIED